MRTSPLLLKISLRFGLLAEGSIRCLMLDERLIAGACSQLDMQMLRMSNVL